MIPYVYEKFFKKTGTNQELIQVILNNNKSLSCTLYHKFYLKMDDGTVIKKDAQFLKKGDKVAIIALASKLNPEDINSAINLMQKNWGIEVIVGESVGASYFNFSGTDDVRLRDFQQQLDNKEIKAVFSARGGYGSSRIIDFVDINACLTLF